MNSKLFNTKDYFNDLFKILTIYNNHGEIYFIGNQVAKNLGYSNHKVAIQTNVPNEFKFSLKDAEKYGITNIKEIIPKIYNQANTVILKEDGLHKLLASSRKLLAKDFCIWLFSEVVPDIRKKGYYIDYSQKDYDKKTEEVQMLREESENLRKKVADFVRENKNLREENKNLKEKSQDTISILRQKLLDFGNESMNIAKRALLGVE